MTEIAVVGASVELPGASDLEELHTDLLRANVHLEMLDDKDLITARRAGVDVDHPRYVPVCTSLPAAGYFDADFFGMTPAEAEWTDPQQRLLMTLTHRAIESAGVRLDGATVGAYTSVSAATYLDDRRPHHERPAPSTVDFRSLIGNDRDFAASRLAYRFGFNGPTLDIQSACSSSLVAVHQACLALAYGDVDAAVVAAASIVYPQRIGYRYSEGGILSRTGRSRPFDIDADGTVRGTGGGAVILRRLDDAVAAGDAIIGIISATAVNNDGGSAMSYSAPSVAGQQRVLESALARSGVDAAKVRHIEAHGTGTALGDPIEFRALRRVYDASLGVMPDCHLGAAKAAFGHLDVAAGMLGLLKTLSVLQYQTVYPQPGFSKPNPILDLSESRFSIANAPTATDIPFAAVSSFGMGGTNAHAILRRPPTPKSVIAPSLTRITLSARTQDGLDQYRKNLAEYLLQNLLHSPQDIAATLNSRAVQQFTWQCTGVDSKDVVRCLTTQPSSIPDTQAAGASIALGHRIWLPSAPLDESELMLSAARNGSSVVQNLSVDDSLSTARTPETVAELFRALVAEEIGRSVPAGADFYEIGGESMGLVAVVGKLADAAEFSPDFASLDGLLKVDEMASELARQADTQNTTPPRAGRGLIQMGHDEPLAYLYPPAGGTNFCYMALHKSAPQLSFASFRAVRPSGSIHSVAEACISELEAGGLIHDGMVLGGYSFGGNVALEMCALLEDRGFAVGGLLLIDSFAPCAFGGARRDIAQLGSEVGHLLADAAGTLPEYQNDVGEQRLREHFVDTWVKNCTALAEHRPKQPVSAPITLLRARTRLTSERAHALGIDPQRTDEWAQYSRASLEVIDVPGDHYTIFTNTAFRAVTAAAVSRVLRRANGGLVSRKDAR